MALYFNGEKLKINIDNTVRKVASYVTAPIVNGIMLLSSDNYVLKDSNGVYLTTKEGK